MRGDLDPVARRLPPNAGSATDRSWYIPGNFFASLTT